VTGCRDAAAYAPIGYPTLRKLLKRWAEGKPLAQDDLDKLANKLAAVSGKLLLSKELKEGYEGLLQFIKEFSATSYDLMLITCLLFTCLCNSARGARACH